MKKFLFILFIVTVIILVISACTTSNVPIKEDASWVTIDEVEKLRIEYFPGSSTDQPLCRVIINPDDQFYSTNLISLGESGETVLYRGYSKIYGYIFHNISSGKVYAVYHDIEWKLSNLVEGGVDLVLATDFNLSPDFFSVPLLQKSGKVYAINDSGLVLVNSDSVYAYSEAFGY